MSPALNNGDYVITVKPRSFRPGLVYVIDHIDLGRIVKRLVRREKQRLIFRGDNSASTPSSIIAPVTQDRVLGRALISIGPKGFRRLGPLPSSPGFEA